MNREADRTTANEIEIVGNEKVVVHLADGHVSEFPDGYLRIKCPCATCTNDGSHTTGPIQLGMSLPVMPARARAGIHPREIDPVGYYAVRIDWSDGHNAGIYSFKYLREICPCPECGSDRS